MQIYYITFTLTLFFKKIQFNYLGIVQKKHDF